MDFQADVLKADVIFVRGGWPDKPQHWLPRYPKRLIHSSPDLGPIVANCVPVRF